LPDNTRASVVPQLPAPRTVIFISLTAHEMRNSVPSLELRVD
jgi:hypothetical protein